MLHRFIAAAVLAVSSGPAFATITGTGQVSPAIANASSWIASQIVVGNTGAGTLTVNGGSTITASPPASDAFEPAIALGYTATGNGSLSLGGATINASGNVVAGYRGVGQLNISSGGVLTTTGNNGNVMIGAYVVTNGVANSTLVVNGGRVTTSRILSMNILNPTAATVYPFDISGGGIVSVGTSFQLNGPTTFDSTYGRGRLAGSSSRLNIGGTASIGQNGKLVFDMSGGAAMTVNSFFDIGYQGETQFNMTSSTITANAFTAAGGSGFATIKLGLGAVFNVSNSSQFGNGGHTFTEVSSDAKFNSTGSITIGGTNSAGSIVSLLGAPTFRSDDRIIVGGSSATRRGNLGLFGSTAEGRAGIFVDRGGLAGGNGTLWSPNGSITVDGMLQTVPTLGVADPSLHLKPATSSSAISSFGTLQAQYNVVGGAMKVGKLVVDSNRLSLGGTLDLYRQETSAAATTATMYSPQTIVDASTGTASYTGKFASFPAMKIDTNTAWAVSYNSRTVIIQRAKFGDADFDNRIDFGDLVVVAQSYNGTGRTWSQGDFTGDGRVNFDDLVLLAQRYQGTTAAGALTADFSADWALAQSLVPEPSTLGMAGGVLIAALRRSKRA